MFCKKCGTEIKTNAKFCVKCGTPVAQTVPTEQPKEQQPVKRQPVKQQPIKQQPVKQQPIEQQQPQKEKKNRKGIKLVICIILICIAALALGTSVTVLVYQNFLSDSKEKEVEADEKENDKEEEDSKVQENDTEGEASEAQEDENASADKNVGSEANANTESNTGSEENEAATQEVGAVAAPEEVNAENEMAIHSYQVVMKDVSWSEAYQEAMQVENGYLVRINSDEEMEQIIKVIQEQNLGNGIFWIGGMRIGESTDYHWIDEQGNAVGDTLNGSAHWLPGEPTYRDEILDTEEKYMNMFYLDSEGRFIWNDTVNELVTLVPTYSGKVGYIVEIENE